jgi:hypothetical protein
MPDTTDSHSDLDIWVAALYMNVYGLSERILTVPDTGIGPN